jgi:hypothetical protein
VTRTAAATIAAGRFVKVDNTQAGAGANTLGVAVAAASAGELLPVAVLGVAAVEAGAAVATGDTIKADADGRAITWATSGAKVAIALTAAAAAGAFIEVFLIPNAQ